MHSKKIKFLKYLLLFCLCLVFYLGKTQYATIHQIAPSPWSYFNRYNELVITTLSNSPIAVNIAGSDGTTYSNNLTTVVGTPLRFRFSGLNAAVNATNTILSGQGLTISASSPISVQLRNIASDNYTISGQNGGNPGDLNACVQKGNSTFMSWGNQGLGTSFRAGYYANVSGAACYTETGAPIYSVMATQNSTQVSVNGTLLTTLNAGQSYMFQAPFGSLISSNNPIVANSGMRVDNSGGCGDGVESQMLPIDQLGTSYVVVRSNGNNTYERSTIIATQPNTSVTVFTPATNTTTTYNLAAAGNSITIANGDGSTQYSTSVITTNNPVAVYTGSASGCEIDQIVQPPITRCTGAFDIQTNQFLNNVNGGNTIFPYFGYAIVYSDTARVFLNGINLETITSARTQIGTTGIYMIRFTNAQLGNTANLRFISTVRMNIAFIQSGAGYSMSSYLTGAGFQPPTVISTPAVCRPSVLAANANFPSYQWYFTGSAISGAINQTYIPLQSQTGYYKIMGIDPLCGNSPMSDSVLITMTNAGTDITGICAGSTQNLSAIPAGGSWSGQNSNPVGATINGSNVTFSTAASGNFNFIYTVNNCPDTMTINVTAKPNAGVDVTGICAGTSRALVATQLGGVWNALSTNAPGATLTGNNVSFATTASGTYSFVYSLNGCSDTVAINVTSKPNVGPDLLSVCAGSTQILSANTPGGTWIAQAGNPTGATLAGSNLSFLITANGGYNFIYNLNGCADTVLVKVSLPTFSITNVSICPSQLPYLWNGINRTAAGTYTFTTTNSQGCDSTATLNLTVRTNTTSTTNVSICPSQLPYLWNGINRTAAGTYTFTTTNSQGCDSVATLNLIVRTNTTSTTNVSICPSQLPYSWNGSRTATGTYTFTTTNSQGCDSTAILNLTVESTVNVGADVNVICGSVTPINLIGSPSGGTWSALNTNPSGVLLSGNTLSFVTAGVVGTFNFIYTVGLCSDTLALNISGIGTGPQIIINSGTNPICKGSTVQLCPASWGWSNYQWYKNGLALAAPIGTGSCITIDSTMQGTYQLRATNGSGCWSDLSNAINVFIDTTCTDTVGPPNGLETKSLGDIIASRLFEYARDSKVENILYNNSNIFQTSGLIIHGINNLSLQQLMPSDIIGIDKSFVTTPQGLTNITNAKEVLAISYRQNNKTKAVTFGTMTLGAMYSHTKPTCDRLNGAQLLEVKNITVGNYNLVAYKMQQCTGEIEHAINLTAGVSSTRNTISLQSNWFTDSYQQDETLFNFQIWAVSYEMAKSIASSIITKLQTQGQLNQVITANDLPSLFISNCKRNKNIVGLNINNTSQFTNAVLEVVQRNVEDGLESVKNIPISILPNSKSAIQVDMKDAYEATINLLINNKKVDNVYVNDGTWSIDYNKNNTTIQQFNVATTPNYQVPASNEEYLLMRNINFNAISRDYVTAYKTIGTKCNALPLNNFNSIKFNANATGASSVTITLISSNIANWNEQYTTTINLSGNQEYGVNLSQFISSKFKTPVIANSLVAISFAFNNGKKGVATSMNVSLSKARFSTQVIEPTLSNAISLQAYPNPNNGNAVTIKFNSAAEQNLRFKLVDITGRAAMQPVTINAIKGTQQQTIKLSNISNGNYFIMLEGDDVHYTPVKLWINK